MRIPPADWPCELDDDREESLPSFPDGDPTDASDFAELARSVEIRAEAAISLAVLKQAADDFLAGVEIKRGQPDGEPDAAKSHSAAYAQREALRAMRDAVAWFVADAERWPWSFRAICDRHGLDPATIIARLGVRRYVAQAQAADWYADRRPGRKVA